MEEDLFTPVSGEGIVSRRIVVEKADKSPEETDFEAGSPILARIQDTRPRHLDGGRAILRPSLPYDSTCRVMSCFLDLYIGSHYAPSPSVPGCVCHATVMSGSVTLTAEGQTFQLLERDAIRFRADQPYRFENMTNSTGRLLLEYQYLHKP